MASNRSEARCYVIEYLSKSMADTRRFEPTKKLGDTVRKLLNMDLMPREHAVLMTLLHTGGFFYAPEAPNIINSMPDKFDMEFVSGVIPLPAENEANLLEVKPDLIKWGTITLRLLDSHDAINIFYFQKCKERLFWGMIRRYYAMMEEERKLTRFMHELMSIAPPPTQLCNEQETHLAEGIRDTYSSTMRFINNKEEMLFISTGYSVEGVLQAYCATRCRNYRLVIAEPTTVGHPSFIMATGNEVSAFGFRDLKPVTYGAPFTKAMLEELRAAYGENEIRDQLKVRPCNFKRLKKMKGMDEVDCESTRKLKPTIYGADADDGIIACGGDPDRDVVEKAPEPDDDDVEPADSA